MNHEDAILDSEWDVCRALQPLKSDRYLIEEARYTNWVLVSCRTRYCRYTDAILGSETTLVGSYNTEAEAISARDSDYYQDEDTFLEVLPPKYLVENIFCGPLFYDRDEIPF